jgi:hypothetical protein
MSPAASPGLLSAAAGPATGSRPTARASIRSSGRCYCKVQKRRAATLSRLVLPFSSFSHNDFLVLFSPPCRDWPIHLRKKAAWKRGLLHISFTYSVQVRVQVRSTEYMYPDSKQVKDDDAFSFFEEVRFSPQQEN